MENHNNRNVTITKYHNCYEISNYDKSRWNKELQQTIGTCPKLDNKYMVFESFMGRISKKDKLGLYNKKTRTLRLPIGVNIETVEELIMTAGNEIDFIDKSNEIVNSRYVEYLINTEFQIRNKYQAEGLSFLTSDELFHSKLLALATGYGKTYTAVMAAFRLKLPILIISETLIQQWIERIEEYTDCRLNTKDIQVIKGTDNFINILNKKSIKYANFYITTSSTLSSAIDKHGRDKVNAVLDRLGIGIKCFDEFHLHWFQNVNIDMNVFTKYTWYLTATPTRTDRNEMRVFNFTMEKIPVYGLQTSKIDTYFNFRLIDYDTHPTEYDISKCVISKGLSPILYWNYIFNNKDKLQYVIDMLVKILDELLEEDENMKIIIYLAKLEHIDTIKTYLEAHYVNQDLNFGNYTSTNKKYKRREINKNIIFTTIGSGGVGLDVPNLRASICLVPFTSYITCSQIIGRLRYIEGKELYFYDFVDTGFKTMIYQRKKRMNIYKPKAKTIKYRKF